MLVVMCGASYRVLILFVVSSSDVLVGFGNVSVVVVLFVFFFEQKTAYEVRISDWSSDVCSSDLTSGRGSPASSSMSMGRKAGRSAISTMAAWTISPMQIGRASWRESVCQYV